MTFLNPLFLLGLAGTAIPVLIHLLNLRTARRVDFSTLEFLRRVEKKNLRRVRVRQWLLLALRMLIIASVALAMSRPALENVGGATSRGAASAAIILDSSASMGARVSSETYFELARKQALDLVESFSEGDELFLFFPGSGVTESPTGVRDRALVRDRLAAAQPGLGAANLDETARRAAQALANAYHPNREIHLFSDFQRTAWPEPPAGAAPFDSNIRTFLIPVAADGIAGDGIPNDAVESIDLSGQLLDTGVPLEIRSVVASGSRSAARDLELELEVDGRVVDRRRAGVASGGRATTVFHEAFAREGIHSGRVRVLAEDAFPLDDGRWFSLRTDREVPVLVVGEEVSTRFLAFAISPGETNGSGSFAVRRGDVRDLGTLSLERESVVLLADVPQLNETALQSIKSFLGAGGGVFVWLGPHVDRDAWARDFFPRFLPARVGGLREAPAGESWKIVRLDPTHSLFDLFRGEGGGLSDARFTRHWDLAPEPGTTSLATFSNGAAALLESTLLPGRVLAFTSSLDSRWSDFPLTGSFLPFVHEAVRVLASTASQEARSLEIGENATLWLPTLPPGGGVVLRSPSGEERQVAGRTGANGVAFNLEGADQPGVWTFTSARGETLATYAVNLPARESDFATLPLAEVESRFAPKQSTVLDAAGNLAEQVRESRVGREIGTYFLWAAAVFLALEMLVAGRQPRLGPAGLER